MLHALSRLNPSSGLGALIRLPLRLIPRNHVATVRGGINKGFQWVVGSSIHGCWLGNYESDKQGLVSKLVRPGMTVWDVGANAGFYTLAFSRRVGAKGRVYAFEPFAENVTNLLRHVRLNQLTNTKIIPAALAATGGLVGFSVAEANSMGHISAGETSYLVPAFSVDEFVTRHPDSRPQLLKIDVEGAESAVLTGATEVLRRFSPEIMLALHGEQQSSACQAILLAQGYRLYYLDGLAVGEGCLKSDEIYACKSGPR